MPSRAIIDARALVEAPQYGDWAGDAINATRYDEPIIVLKGLRPGVLGGRVFRLKQGTGAVHDLPATVQAEFTVDADSLARLPLRDEVITRKRNPGTYDRLVEIPAIKAALKQVNDHVDTVLAGLGDIDFRSTEMEFDTRFIHGVTDLEVVRRVRDLHFVAGSSGRGMDAIKAVAAAHGWGRAVKLITHNGGTIAVTGPDAELEAAVDYLVRLDHRRRVKATLSEARALVEARA